MSANVEYIASTGNDHYNTGEVIETSARVLDDSDSVAETDYNYYPIVQRDPADIRMTFRLVAVMALLLISNLILGSLLTYKSIKAPSMIVVERTAEGDRVIGSDKAYALSGPIQVGPMRLSDGDKKHAARMWAEGIYQIDPNLQIRRSSLERSMKQMTFDAVSSLFEQVKKTGEWERQRKEEWKAVWKPQSVEISPDDPYKVQMVGIQEITKKIAGSIVRQNRQLMFTVELLPDKRKRTAENQNTGFLVNGTVQYKELELPQESEPAVEAQPNATQVTQEQPQQQ